METRESPRYPISLTARVEVDPSAQQHFGITRKDLEATIFDISLGGIGLEASFFIPRGVILLLTFTVCKTELTLKGEVRWVKPAGRGQTRFGIRFIDVTDEQKKIIERFLKENEKRQHPRMEL